MLIYMPSLPSGAEGTKQLGCPRLSVSASQLFFTSIFYDEWKYSVETDRNINH